MKTGGTLNFLKRAGAILMLLAIFASSCNKYADDFKQINTKLDALLTQVDGATTLSVSLAALAKQVTDLQTAVSGLPTTASITTLTGNLKTVGDNVIAIQSTLLTIANAGSATKAVVDQLKIDLAALANTVIGTDATILAKITILQTSLNGIALTGSATDTATALTIQGLQLMLNAQNLILAKILASVNMYNGDVVITTYPEMAFYYSKLSQMGIINGNVTINTTNLTDSLAKVNMITSKITAVIGTAGSTKDSVGVVSTSTTTPLDLSALVNVAGAYRVIGVNISDNNLTSVGGNFTVSYDGPYLFPNLSTVSGNLTLTKVASSPTKFGTTSINLPLVVVTGSVFDGVGAAGVLVYPDASSIVLSGGVTSLAADKATIITLGATDYTASAGLTLSSSLTAAAVVDLSKATGSTSTKAISITAYKGSSVLLTKLTKAPNGLTINLGTSGTVDLTALASTGTTTSTDLNLTGPAIVTLPALATGLVTSNATTVSMAVHTWATPASLANVTSLTLGKIANPVWAGNYATLKSLDVTGVATTTTLGWSGLTSNTVTTSVSNTHLTRVSLGGNLSSALIQSNDSLTTVTTNGIVNSLYIDNNKLLNSVTLANTHYEGGPGSDLVVTNNAILPSLITSANKMKSLKVTGNPLLTILRMASYVNAINTTNTVSIEIGANKLTGTYTAPIPATATTLLVEGKVVSVDLLTISGYVATLAAATGITLSVTADLYDSNGTASGTTALSVAMKDPGTYDNAWGLSKVDATGGINSAAEFTLVQ